MSDTVAKIWAPSFFASLACASSHDDDDAIARSRSREITEADTQRSHRDPTHSVLIGGVPLPFLLRELRAGQRDAMATVYDALFEPLWNIAAMETRSRETAIEIVHDVFLSLWARRETIEQTMVPGTDLRVYLAAAVRNRARNLRRHARVVDAAANALGAAGDSVAHYPAMGQRDRTADALAEEEEFRGAYNRAIRTLTDQERLAVFLRWEEEWSFEQIGEVLSLSKVGARKVVLRAQRKVQLLLADYRD